MIFVTVGTGNFDNLVRRMDELAPSLAQEVICQIGRGAYLPRHCKYFRHAPSLDEYVRRARLVVGHGGLGTVMGAVRLGKPFIGMSNPSRPDHHQDQILGTLEERGHIIWCRSFDDLDRCIERALSSPMTAYVEPRCQIPQVIREFLLHAPADRRTRSLQEIRS